MDFQQEFKGWDNLTIQDLVLAYRKAKADCYFENAFPTAIEFANYELHLMSNLDQLLHSLRSNSGFSSDKSLLGSFRLIPKKLTQKPKSDCSNGHTHFSDAKKAFEHLQKNNHLIPEFRVIGDFPINTHILSALWINLVGHKFDSCLSDRDVYGSRLKRVRDNGLNLKSPRAFHIAAIGSFLPYFQPYQKWRNDGFKAIRSELEQERKIVAVSLDLKSYYHLIDPSFIASTNFQQEIGLIDEHALTVQEILFTKQLSDLLCAWSEGASGFAKDIQDKNPQSINGGLTIGLTASRVISNVLLYKWDRLIREKLTPVHYGRYVDDMFLVMHDGGAITDTVSFMRFLEERLPNTVKKLKTTKEDTWQIDLQEGYQKNHKYNCNLINKNFFYWREKLG